MYLAGDVRGHAEIPRPQPAMAVPLLGKFGGRCACEATFSYFFPLPNLLNKSFVFKNDVAKEGLKEDNHLAWAQEISGLSPGA